MGQSLAAQLSNNLLVRTGVVTLVVVGFFAVATGALPVRCMIGGKCDVANMPPAPTQTAVAAPDQTAAVAPAEIAPSQAALPGMPGVAMVKPVIEKVAPPSLTHNDVLAGTFAQLKVEMKAPVATSVERVAKATGSAHPEADSGLTTRTVRALTIKPDGTPDFGSQVAEAYAGALPPAAVPPALDAAVKIGSGQRPSVEPTPPTAKVAIAEPDAAPDAAKKPAAKGTATVLGKGANVRHVYNIMPEDDGAANALLVVEVITPQGNTSSYPPHKHDQDNLPHESQLEETYYHRMNPPQGFAFQRVYTDDRSLDEAMAIENGDVVLVPRGYHPVATTAGYDLYYLNVMAGPKRVWKFHNAPEHEWMLE